MKIKVDIRRAYEKAGKSEGYRVLVDRIWPRGISKDELHFDTWCKDLAPSPELRKWFAHKVENWDRFRKDYQAELRGEDQKERIRQLVKDAGESHITLLYGARDTEHNHALILADEISHVAASMRKSAKSGGEAKKSA